METGTTFHYILRCQLFQKERTTLLNDIEEIYKHIKIDHTNDLDQILLYGNECFNYDTHRIILVSVIEFCIDSKKLDFSLFYFAFYVS